MHRTRQSYYFNGERPSKLLALRIKQMESRAIIHAIKNEDSLYTQPEDINQTFKTYYEQLYTSNSSSYQQHTSFLQQLHLSKIDKHHQEMLNCPLSLEELKLALDTMPKKKSPGIDGIPPELISAIWDIVSPLILNSFNFAVGNGALHRDQNTALITLLLKKGKDPLECASYRPISLITTDVKLFAKALAF